MESGVGIGGVTGGDRFENHSFFANLKNARESKQGKRLPDFLQLKRLRSQKIAVLQTTFIPITTSYAMIEKHNYATK